MRREFELDIELAIHSEAVAASDCEYGTRTMSRHECCGVEVFRNALVKSEADVLVAD